MSTSRFEACLRSVLAHEGGYVDHPRDPGGATNLGITRRTLARWRNVSPWWHLPKAAVRTLTREEAARIYRALYWTRVDGDRLPAGIDLALFDYAVNSGPDRAVRSLQAIVGTRRDGLLGPLTRKALDRYIAARGRAGAIEALTSERLGFLRALETFSVFGRGWTRRVETVRRAALASAGISTPVPSVSPSKETTMLSGYRTYIVAAMMLLAGLASILGIEVPVLDGAAGGQLILEALAVIFLRKGLKSDIANA